LCCCRKAANSEKQNADYCSYVVLHYCS
jgi:hypothetical protein